MRKNMITKQAIVDAAIGLSKRKHLDKITVTDIVKECHIARQTFYYHFQDIEDVVDWGMQQRMDELVGKAQACQSAEEALLYYCNYLMEDKNFFGKVMASRYMKKGLLMLLEGTRHYLYSLVKFHADDFDLPVSELRFAIDYHAGAISSRLVQWTWEKNVDLEEEVRQIMRVVRGEVRFSSKQ